MRPGDLKHRNFLIPIEDLYFREGSQFDRMVLSLEFVPIFRTLGTKRYLLPGSTLPEGFHLPSGS